MNESIFGEGKMVAVLREAEHTTVAEVSKKHKVGNAAFSMRRDRRHSADESFNGKLRDACLPSERYGSFDCV